MKFKRFIPLFFLFGLLAFPAVSQEFTQSCRGLITDKDSGEPLPGVNVTVLDGSEMVEGVSTDFDGNFRIDKLGVGRYTFRITYIGYEPIELSEIQIISGKEKILDLELTESIMEIGEVVVSSGARSSQPVNSMAIVSARSFTIEQSERFAASINDPARLALSFAGVKGENDIINSISIRGNSPKGLLWRIEGVEVPSPNHFSEEGGSGGAVSILSNNVLSASDFYTGAFPAEYGNALSGVMDLKLRKGNNEKSEIALQLGLMGLEAALEGPLTKKKKASYLVNYRYSTLAFFDKIGYSISQTTTEYQDINFKIQSPAGKKGTISLFALGGLSSIVTPNRNWDNTEETKSYDMGVIGVNTNHRISSRSFLKSSVSVAGNKEDYEQFNTGQGKRSTSWKYLSTNIILRSYLQLNTKLSASSSLRSGLIFSNTWFSLIEGENIDNPWMSADTVSQKIQVYYQWRYRFNSRLTFLSGLHGIFFSLNKNYSVDPRFGITYKLSESQVINFAVGLHSFTESIGFYTVREDHEKDKTIHNEDLELSKAFHLVVGLDQQFKKHLSLKVELYYQYLFDIPVARNDKDIFSSVNYMYRYPFKRLDNDGAGKNYGIELTIEKSFNSNYYVLASGSMFDSRYKAADGIWRNTSFDAGFITSITAGKDFEFGGFRSGNNVFGLNTRILWSGGYRTLESEYAEQISNYFRVDLRASFRKNKNKYSWELSADIQNLTNRYNENISRDIEPMGLLPIARWRVEI